MVKVIMTLARIILRIDEQNRAAAISPVNVRGANRYNGWFAPVEKWSYYSWRVHPVDPSGLQTDSNAMRAKTLPSIQSELLKTVEESTLRRLLAPPKQVTRISFFLQLRPRMLLLLIFSDRYFSVGCGDKLLDGHGYEFMRGYKSLLAALWNDLTFS